MKRTHNQEREQFKKLFSNENIDRFEDRFKILEAFLQTERHVTDRELGKLLAEGGDHLEEHLVKDTLDLMCHYGFAQANRFDNGVVRYEHRHLGQHHDHMICTKCRSILEFRNDQLEALQKQIAGEHGFHMLQHRMEIYGICSDCLRYQVDSYPLSDAKQGERVVIQAFQGGPAARMRLMTMGLRVGDGVEVLTNLSQGQVVLAVDHSRLALGRGLAQKVMVRSEGGLHTRRRAANEA